MICELMLAAACAAVPEWAPVTREAKPWAYNWWMASAVDREGLEAQCAAMEEAGMGGFHVIPIYGAKGYEAKYLKYLSPEWMQAFRDAVEIGAKHGLGVDMTMGNGWCFGGPQLKPEQGCWKMEKTPDGQPPYVTWSLTGQKVKRAGPGGKGPMMDPFSAEAIDAFLAPYSVFDAPGAAKPLHVYHDSWEYFRAGWSPALFDAFKAKRGYDLRAQPIGAVARRLSAEGCAFDYVSDRQLQRLDLSRYARVVVPPCRHMPEATKAAIARFTERPVRIEPFAAAGLAYSRYRRGDESVYFIVNTNATRFAAALTPTAKGAKWWMDPMTGEVRPTDDCIELEPYESGFLVVKRSDVPRSSDNRTIEQSNNSSWPLDADADLRRTRTAADTHDGATDDLEPECRREREPVFRHDALSNGVRLDGSYGGHGRA